MISLRQSTPPRELKYQSQLQRHLSANTKKCCTTCSASIGMIYLSCLPSGRDTGSWKEARKVSNDAHTSQQALDVFPSIAFNLVSPSRSANQKKAASTSSSLPPSPSFTRAIRPAGSQYLVLRQSTSVWLLHSKTCSIARPPALDPLSAPSETTTTNRKLRRPSYGCTYMASPGIGQKFPPPPTSSKESK